MFEIKKLKARKDIDQYKYTTNDDCHNHSDSQHVINETAYKNLAHRNGYFDKMSLKLLDELKEKEENLECYG